MFFKKSFKLLSKTNKCLLSFKQNNNLHKKMFPMKVTESNGKIISLSFNKQNPRKPQSEGYQMVQKKQRKNII